MPTLDELLEHKDDPMKKRLQRQMLKTVMTQAAGTKLETVRQTLKPTFEMDTLKDELYSALLNSFEGKAQKALAQRISESARLIAGTENNRDTFINSFKTR
ncbi:hypothetical protein P9738_06810 [Bacillus siamensis]|uniref:hypothetical protein n=1 Tax=Bacillus siamensis TaxID=659243 RepID=UPI0006463EEA|nr:hypothetical protein [Bacillus siamensis]MDU0812034.1 hypothetical protein [Bacillus siamensis]MED5047731.1 hypothetical protein [Bacillus siamensis]MED5095997.1 hypothetical protein [Bacillus siamensis]QQD81539.1 hypothetical protein JD965_16940 [Bacillus siamensis]